LTNYAACGTAAELIRGRLSGLSEFGDYLAGRLTREDFQAVVDGLVPAAWGLNTDQLNLATRFPVDEEHLVDTSLSALAASGLLTGDRYPQRDFAAHRDRVAAAYHHADRLTYIFPEEARLLYAITYLTRPRRALFLGSYYGYWAVWALPGIVAAGGRAVLIDPDPDVLALSRKNFEVFGYADHCDFVCDDAVAYLTADARGCDMVVLDAEGPVDEGPADRRGKAIYHPLTAAATPRLALGGLLVAHNILLDNLSGNAYFADRIEANRRQFSAFLPYLREHYDVRYEIPTTEGVGVYRRGGALEP
jgi:predicted O-methyltransferase YrrM